ncbi:MAG TPA: ABC transporter ATP-binding protein [Microvirga sp.]|nr:ABC transporter ATP-binding protein [Microvirga sp.]
MERDPIRLAWTTSPGRHLVAGLLLLAAGVLVFAGLDLVRVAIDHLVGGRGPAPLMRVAIPLPGGLAPLVLIPGFTVEAASFRLVALAVLVAIPVLVGLLVLGVELIGAALGGRILARVRGAILDAVLDAPPSARDEAAQAASFAGDALARDSAVLGSALLAPLQAGSVVAAALLYALLADWRLGVAVAGLLVLAAALNGRRLDGRVEAGRARRAEGAAIDLSFADALRRLPALRAHGTGRFERQRVGAAFRTHHGPVEARERRAALADAAASVSLLLTPVAALGLAGWLAAGRDLTPGQAAAVAAGAAVAALNVRELTQWQRLVDGIRPVLREVSRSVAVLHGRERRARAAALPGAGALVASGVSALDPASGGRISGVDLSVAFPAHVALVGDGEAGSRVFARLIGGLLEPSTGRITYGGVDLAGAAPEERARRIAFAGGDTILIPGTLRDNLLYGCPGDGPDVDARLAEAVAVAGLDRRIHAAGLNGTLDPAREPRLAAALVESRRAVQAALAADSLDRFVDPFDAERYNHHATVGENLLFGKPIGDTFREDNLSAHPFVRAVLEADDLTKPLAAMGLQIARSMIEIFADIPDGHPLFERFSFFAAADRPYFEDLVERRTERRRGAESARDRERLIGLALRYSESRHRLGLIDDGLQARLLAARADFARMLPVSLKPAIEFYDEARLCTAASVQDNLLFGRIASDQAGAESAVHGVIRRVLTERGLDGDVTRIGLQTPVDPRGGDLTLSDIAAVDLVRCLVRRPDVIVVERALEGLPGPSADALVARLRRALVGRGLVIVSPSLSADMDQPPFDALIRFERGTPQVEERRIRRAEPAVA